MVSSTSSSRSDLPPISPRNAFLALKPWLRDRLHEAATPPESSLQRALAWLAEADAYARIQGISLNTREWMYRHGSPSALYTRLEFAEDTSLHGVFSPEDQRQIQDRRDARQRQIARRAGAPLALKQRYRPDCCEGCGLPTVPRRECQNPRHLGTLLSLPSLVPDDPDLSGSQPSPPSNENAWGESSGWGASSGWGEPEASQVNDDLPEVVESNPWWYGDQRMLLIPADDEISPPGSPGHWKTDYDCTDDMSDDYNYMYAEYE
ncbi:hypothetical protein C8F01DRAFT_1254033 [Mycena amicta]|nr:hypothetical protein C8F01DRAFT_1254033 [Mycena amicta]